MRVITIIAVGLAIIGCAREIATAPSEARAMVVVSESDVTVEEAPPHGAIGMSTAFRISDAAPGRIMEFRRRVLHVGAAVGSHVISHDEVYYVTAGVGEVDSDGETAQLSVGMAAYLYEGANVGIRQIGNEPLSIIIAYPLSARREEKWREEKL